MGDRPKPGYAYVGPVALPEELVQRFWARVNLAGPPPPLRPDLGPCWLWRGVPDKDGYGRIHVRGDTVAPYAAHRVAWAIHFGRWPDPMALHRCDVRPCVRWEHLYEGSKADNATDRDFGRHFRSLRAGACRR